nr:MAG TPA: hypothetical protein [Bacteriophage sp.]
MAWQTDTSSAVRVATWGHGRAHVEQGYRFR